jgi:hypothetical protein
MKVLFQDRLSLGRGVLLSGAGVVSRHKKEVIYVPRLHGGNGRSKRSADLS